MNDTLRVTVVATGIGMEKYSDVNQTKNKSSKEILMDYRYQYLNISPTAIDKKNVKNEIKETDNKKRKEPEYLDIPAFLRKRSD
jgi:cell division protein FtsZ